MCHLKRIFAAKLPIAQGMLGAEVEETKSKYLNNFVFIFLLLVLPLAPEASLRVSLVESPM